MGARARAPKLTDLCFTPSRLNRSVLQPTLERASDPALQSQFSALSSRAKETISGAARVGGQVLSTGLEQGSTILRRDLGVNVGDLGASYLDRATGRGAGEGYGRVGEDHAPAAHSALEPGRGDFFDEQLMTTKGNTATPAADGGGGFRDMPTARATSRPSPSPSTSPAPSSSSAATPSSAAPARRLSPPPAAAPVIDASWDSLAPQAAARRAQQEKEAPKKTAEEEEWESW